VTPRLGVADTVLHFIYNAVVTSTIIVPFWFVVRNRNRHDRKAAELAQAER
jgi:type IV secretory pathway VirB3-like protein